MKTSLSLSNVDEIARRGETIYQGRYKQRFETEHPKKFVAIDVGTELAYIGETPEEALDKATAEAPEGMFHLIQIGLPAAFRISHVSHAPTRLDWTI